MRILVVEDEIKTADYLQKGLSESGYSVDVAHDGLVGQQRISEEHFDLIILDVIPPMLTGGAHPTLADLAIVCELHQIMAVGYWFENYPHVKAWLHAMAERPHVHAVSEEIRAQGQEIKTQNSDYLALDAFG